MMPLVWIMLALIYALITKNPKRRKRGLITALILVLFFGNDFIINEAMLIWEKDPVPIAAMKTYETAIVLTGITNTEKEINDRVYFQKGADRLLHTVQLYKSGKIKKILVSGGSGLVIGHKTVSEADQLKIVFLYCGVSEKDIIIENRSRNTRENALFSKETIDSLQLKGNFLLITSSFHMRRSNACFQKVGLEVDTFPVDIYTRDRKYTPNILIIPSEQAIGKWSLLVHEVIGYLVYKVMGYC